MDIAATYADCFYELSTVHKGYVTPVLLSSALFVNKVLTLFTCSNGSEKDTGVNENEHRCDPLLYIWFKIKILSHPAITDSRYYGHQVAVPRVSAATGVDCNHDFDLDDVKVIDRCSQWGKRLFLEAWYSIREPNSINEHVYIPDIYKALGNPK